MLLGEQLGNDHVPSVCRTTTKLNVEVCFAESMLDKDQRHCGTNHKVFDWFGRRFGKVWF